MEPIKATLTGGNRRSLGRTEEVVQWVLANHDRLPELFETLLDDDEIVRMRAGDALEKVCRQHPFWLAPYTERLLTEIAAIDQPSVQWHLAQMLGEIALGAEDRARAIDLLKRNLERYQDWIVINLTLETLAKLAREDDDLRRALPVILVQHMDSRHKSVAARARKLLRALGKA